MSKYTTRNKKEEARDARAEERVRELDPRTTSREERKKGLEKIHEADMKRIGNGYDTSK